MLDLAKEQARLADEIAKAQALVELRRVLTIRLRRARQARGGAEGARWLGGGAGYRGAAGGAA
jgi:hypothetical protein